MFRQALTPLFDDAIAEIQPEGKPWAYAHYSIPAGYSILDVQRHLSSLCIHTYVPKFDEEFKKEQFMLGTGLLIQATHWPETKNDSHFDLDLLKKDISLSAATDLGFYVQLNVSRATFIGFVSDAHAETYPRINGIKNVITAGSKRTKRIDSKRKENQVWLCSDYDIKRMLYRPKKEEIPVYENLIKGQLYEIMSGSAAGLVIKMPKAIDVSAIHTLKRMALQENDVVSKAAMKKKLLKTLNSYLHVSEVFQIAASGSKTKLCNSIRVKIKHLFSENEFCPLLSSV